MKTDVILKGECSEGYQGVKDLFSSHLGSGKDENAQLCVYVDGKRVVDLWGSSIGDENYGPDDLQIVFSSGKSVGSFVVALMVDRGLLNYDDKISMHWPQFAKKGKQDLTVADVLRHESGLASSFEEKLTLDDIQTDQIKLNAVGRKIEDTRPVFQDILNKDGTVSKRSYHAQTRGLVLNEVIRRVDPQGRTLGEILRQDVGIPGIRVGLTEDELRTRVTPSQKQASIAWTLYYLFLGNKIYTTLKSSIFLVLSLLYMLPGIIYKSATARPLWDSKMKSPYAFFNQDKARTGELFSANTHASARGLAELGNNLFKSSGGLLRAETCKQLHANPKMATDAAIKGLETNFSQGGVNFFLAPPTAPKLAQLRKGWVGWMGLGGSVFQWHPELKISFAYVPTLLQPFDLMCLRGAFLQSKVAKCVESIHKGQ